MSGQAELPLSQTDDPRRMLDDLVSRALACRTGASSETRRAPRRSPLSLSINDVDLRGSDFEPHVLTSPAAMIYQHRINQFKACLGFVAGHGRKDFYQPINAKDSSDLQHQFRQSISAHRMHTSESGTRERLIENNFAGKQAK